MTNTATELSDSEIEASVAEVTATNWTAHRDLEQGFVAQAVHLGWPSELRVSPETFVDPLARAVTLACDSIVAQGRPTYLDAVVAEIDEPEKYGGVGVIKAALICPEEPATITEDRKREILESWQVRQRRDNAKQYASLRAVRFNVEAEPNRDVSILSLGGVSVCRKGGISSTQAKKKSGKTAFLEGAAAAMIAPNDLDGDFLGWQRDTPEPLSVVHFDCEQSRHDHWHLGKRILNRAGMPEGSPLFHSYNLTGWSVEDAKESLALLLKWGLQPGVGLVLIDGIADLVHDVNDQAESNGLVSWLMRLAIEHDTHIHGVLHLNPGSNNGLEKARGHLGSQMERKAETIIQLERPDEDSVIAFTAASRKAPLHKKDAVRFGFSEEHGRWESLDALEDVRRGQKAEEARGILSDVFGEDLEDRCRYNALVKKLEEAGMFSNGTAKGRLRDYLAEGYVEKFSDDGVHVYGLGRAGKSLVTGVRF